MRQAHAGGWTLAVCSPGLRSTLDTRLLNLVNTARAQNLAQWLMTLARTT